MDIIRDRLQVRPCLVLDGAMGTLLMEAGLESGSSPEAWNVSHPERIREIHQGYARAGADIILTNSFGGSPFRLKRHGLEDRVFELNQAAARIAREVAEGKQMPPQGGDGSRHTILVGGSIGPSGELKEPLGVLTPEEAREGFSRQASGLASGGVDLIWIETMSDPNEATTAIEGTREVCDLPIALTMTFDAGGRTMMGTTPEQALETFSRFNLVAVGANCGNGPQEIEAVVKAMVALEPGIPVIAKSNAGIPGWVDGELVYDGTPEVMREYAHRVCALGAQLIGGCCGTTPAHIRAMAEGLRRGADPLPL